MSSVNSDQQSVESSGSTVGSDATELYNKWLDSRRRSSAGSHTHTSYGACRPRRESVLIQGDLPTILADYGAAVTPDREEHIERAIWAIQVLLVIQTSIYSRSLISFLNLVDPGASLTFFGVLLSVTGLAIVVSGAAAAQSISYTGRTFETFIVSLVITIIGHGVLAFTDSFTNSKWVLFAARILIGTGFGAQGAVTTLLMIRLHEGDKVSWKQESVNAVGVILGPSLSIVLLNVPKTMVGWFHLDMFSAAAIICVILGSIQLVCTFIFVRDVDACNENIPNFENDDKKTSITSEAEGKHPSALSSDISVVAAIAVRFLLLFALTYDRALNAPFLHVMLGWSSIKVILVGNCIQIAIAVVDFVGAVVTKAVVPNVIPRRYAVMGGLTFAVIYFLLLFSWSEQPVLSLWPESKNVFASTCIYHWCSFTGRVAVWQYGLSQVSLTLALILGFSTNADRFASLCKTSRFHPEYSQRAFYIVGQVAIVSSPLTAMVTLQFAGPHGTIGVGIVISGLVLLLFVAGFFSRCVKNKLLSSITDEEKLLVSGSLDEPPTAEVPLEREILRKISILPPDRHYARRHTVTVLPQAPTVGHPISRGRRRSTLFSGPQNSRRQSLSVTSAVLVAEAVSRHKITDFAFIRA